MWCCSTRAPFEIRHGSNQGILVIYSDILGKSIFFRVELYVFFGGFIGFFWSGDL